MHPGLVALILAASLVVGWLFMRWGEKDHKKMIEKWEKVEKEVYKYKRR